MRRYLLVAIGALGVSFGCGGDDTKSISGAPDCADGELVIVGELGGQTINISQTGYNTFIFTNSVGDANGTFSVGFPSQERVTLDFPDFVRNNDTVRARGSLEFGSLLAGYCDTMTAYPGELLVPKEGGQYEFSLIQLRDGEPFCTAELLSGEVVGCFKPRPSAMVDAGM